MDSQLSKSDIAAVVELVLAVTQRPPGLKSRGRPLLQKLSQSLHGAQGCFFLLSTSPANSAAHTPLIHTTDPSEHGHKRAAAAIHIVRNRLLTQSRRPGIGPKGLTAPAVSPAASLAAQTATWRQPIENGHTPPNGHTDPAAPDQPPDGELLCSIRPLDASRFSCLTLHRPRPAACFTGRDLAFVELVHHTCPLIGGHRVEPEDAPTIPPRRREVLDFLCDGHSEKEISSNMGITPGTVHCYVKALYKQFQVTNRGELLSLWIQNKRATRKSRSQ